MPILFCGECKPKEIITDDVQAQLAAALNATLILLILYYLDTRETVSTPMPPWLFIFGIAYVAEGFMVYAHYPRYDFDREGRGKWGFVSVPVTDSYVEVFTTDTIESKRIFALAALFRMREHGCFLLDKLADWKNSGAALVVLQKQALFERASKLVRSPPMQ